MSASGNWFIGLPVPELPDYDRILAECPPELRRFHPADLHVTVAFLGPVEAARAWQAWERLDDIAGGPFTVTLGGLLAFGRPRRPSAFAFELDRGGEAVAGLIHSRQSLLRQTAGLQPERRLPRPHVTVARPNRQATPQVRQAALRWAATVSPPVQPLRLNCVALYRWAENRRQRLFSIEARRNLS